MTSRDPKHPAAAAAPELREDDGPELADTLTPLRADDPEPQQVPQLPPALARRRAPRRGSRPDRVLDASAWGPAAAALADAPLPRALYVARGPGQGQLVPLHEGALVIGRAPSSDLRLAHPSISRRHAQLVCERDRLTVRDLGSQNGTWVNGRRARGEVALVPGDRLVLGNSLLEVRGPDAPAAPPPSGLGPRLRAWLAALGGR